MPNPDEAREAAWRTWLGESMPGESGFRFAWDARGRYDEQRIADLEAALRRYMWIRMVTSQQDR